MSEAPSLINSLRDVLLRLKERPYSHVPNPADCKKRASVTVILRVRPKYQPLTASPPNASQDRLVEPLGSSRDPDSRTDPVERFFAQDWVKQGEPDILFIKRAGRAGDRWSGHIALPGGKRDPEDADDLAAAVRETREEVGLDLTISDCIPVGNLPERLVTTTWGHDALMVLCPYIFLLTSPHPPLRPQPTEVAACHWVPLRALLSPAQRTREYVDTSSRVHKNNPILANIMRILLGKMMFSAVQLIPSESLYATSIDGFVPEIPDTSSTVLSSFVQGVIGTVSSHQQPLLLWGLTLGVLADFMDMLPPHNAIRLWTYPTFTTPDLRLLIYITTRSLRMKNNNPGQISSGSWPSQTTIDASTEAVALSSGGPPEPGNNSVGISGLGLGTGPEHAARKMLTGYYDRMTLTIRFFLLYRAVFGSVFLFWLYKAWRRRQSAK